MASSTKQTNLLHVDTMTGAAEDQASLHRLGESLGLESGQSE
jgi:hypothetical protein